MTVHWQQMTSVEKAEALKAVLLMGHISFSYVAGQIPGCTRNAAIGCYHRNKKIMPALGVAMGHSTEARKKHLNVAPAPRITIPVTPRRPVRAAAAAVVPTPKVRLPFLNVVEVGATEEFVKTTAEMLAEDAGKRLAARKTLDDLADNECHFPTWPHYLLAHKDAAPEFPAPAERLYCGLRIETDSGHDRYCLHHARLTSNGIPARSPSPVLRRRIQK